MDQYMSLVWVSIRTGTIAWMLASEETLHRIDQLLREVVTSGAHDEMWCELLRTNVISPRLELVLEVK